MRQAEDGGEIVVVIGTRPELIKLAPLVLQLRRHGRATTVVATGQHGEVLTPLFEHFGIWPDTTLQVAAAHRRSLTHLLASMSTQLDEVLRPRTTAVVVQGDTTSALAGALAGFHAGVPVVHLEAGLRTGDLASPFPEEGNRALIGRLAALHLAPTGRARAALLAEGIHDDRIVVTGNTVIDALHLTARSDPAPLVPAQQRSVLVTAHRRESWAVGLSGMLEGVAAAARRHPEVRFDWVTHPNPSLRARVAHALDEITNVRLLEPLAYPDMVRALRQCSLVLTDSGGLQEEAPSFGKPVLVLRETTERLEAVEAGCAQLVGSSPTAIVEGVSRLLCDPAAYASMSRAGNPYGDGRAAERAVQALLVLCAERLVTSG